MKTSMFVFVLVYGLLFSACEKKDDSSTAGSKATSGPTVPSPSSGSSMVPVDTRAAKWNLKVYDPNEATLISSGVSPDREALRVDIKKAGPQTSWQIQLNLAPLAVQGGRRYKMDFQARADSARNAFVGFARAHDPWTDLGLYRNIPLSPEWHSFQEEFVASTDDDNARILFDLGGSAASAELRDVKLYRIGG